MKMFETSEVLTKIAAFDRRTLGEADVMAWHEVIGELDRDDAMEAVRRWYGEHTEWIMPAHLKSIVKEITDKRRAAEQHTGWAPGQAGISRTHPLPEVSGRIEAETISPEVRALLSSVRAMLPEGSREALMPRRVAWERENKAFQRASNPEPNPHYKPARVRLIPCGCGPEHGPQCPSFGQPREEEQYGTGILPDAHRCADCTFTTASEHFMEAHQATTGHLHE